MERWTTDGPVSFIFCPTQVSLKSPRSDLDTLLTKDDHRARFYECYREEAEEYDREFMKKYDEDLNTTLIFVSFCIVLQGCKC